MKDAYKTVWILINYAKAHGIKSTVGRLGKLNRLIKTQPLVKPKWFKGSRERGLR
tara:strand:+ start:2750 stop:2914 length:165 start_codon:yes stop_codon:yes gene_type:complete